MIKLVMIALSLAAYEANNEEAKRHLSGPFYKNQHVSGKYQSELSLYSLSSADLTGPEAKNRSVAERKKSASLSKISIGKKSKLTGPMGKNRKPWRK